MGQKTPETDQQAEVHRRLWRALFEQLGGDEVVGMVNAWAEGLTFAEIGRRHGVSPSTACKRVRGVLAEHGLLPNRWARRRRAG